MTLDLWLVLMTLNQFFTLTSILYQIPVTHAFSGGFMVSCMCVVKNVEWCQCPLMMISRGHTNKIKYFEKNRFLKNGFLEIKTWEHSKTQFRLRFSLSLKGEVDSIAWTFDMLLTLKKNKEKKESRKIPGFEVGTSNHLWLL